MKNIVRSSWLPVAALLSLVSAVPTVQQPLTTDVTPDIVLNALKKNEVIPDVLDPFVPLFEVRAVFNNEEIMPSQAPRGGPLSGVAEFSSIRVELGTSVPVSAAQSQPLISIVPLNGTDSVDATTVYTLAMTDPDAPSRKNPTFSEMCHWLTTGIKINTIERETLIYAEDLPLEMRTMLPKPYLAPDDLLSYKPPGPPPKTGFHRYVFVLMRSALKGNVDKPLLPPSTRPKWGFSQARSGVRAWAKRESLEVVGANFFVSQNVKQ